MNNTYKTNKTDWRRLVRSILFVALLLGASLPAMAADYVFLYNSEGTFHILSNTSNTITDVTTFSYTNCVWSGTSGSTFSNQERYLYWTNNNSVWTANTSGDNLTINGNKIYNTYRGSNYYIRYNSNQWVSSTTNSQNEVVYLMSTQSDQSLSTPTIASDDFVFTDLTSHIYSASATYTYKLYKLAGASNYYVVEGGTPSTSTTAPTTTDGITYVWSLADGTTDNGHVRINPSTGDVTYYNAYTDANHTVGIKVTATHSASGLSQTSSTKNITVNKLTAVNPTGITATDITVSQGNTITATNYTTTATLSAGQYPYSHVTATSDATDIATVANVGDGFTITGVAVGSATITIKAYNIGNSVVACSTTFTVTVTEPETGISGSIVILNDYEDHNWAYYNKEINSPIRSWNPADVKITYYGDGIVMTGNNDYTASSTDFVQPGNANYVGGAKVNVGGEDENTFVYYKTLERTDGSTSANPTGRCLYTTIPNPFQVRPTYGSRGSTDANDFTGWRGFQCWRLKSVTGGSVYSAASGGTALATGAIINGETDIYFAPSNEYGMEVELEAVWAKAYLVKGNNGNANAILNHGDLGVERNFMTLTDGQSYRFNGTSGRRITNVDRAVTISSYYPNGEAPDGTNNTITGNNNNITLGADTKFENVTLSAGSYTLTASGYDVIVGRGCTSTNVGTVRGMSDGSTSAVNYTIRLESGTFGTFALIDNTARTFSSTISTRAVFGSDYDRAKSDNSKLSIAASSTIYGGNAAHTFSGSANRNNITYDWLIKSGRVQGSTSVGDAAADKSIYIGNSISGSNANSIQYCGKRRLTMEGGEIASIAGSVNCYGNNYANYGVNDGTWSVMIRLKGGTVRGSIYGAAAYAGASGDRLFIMTGGTVNGWVAGGANGTQSDGGMMYGASSIYIGGNTSINSNSSTTVINRAVGGNVFGAGCGYGTSSNSGQVTAGTTVVVADDAYVERGVYGGGSYGYTTSTSNVYIMGGTVDCKAGGVNGTTYNANVNGGVYGGACQNRAGVNNVKVYGGTVNGGVYGGGNVSGDVAGPITVDVYGTDQAPAANAYAIHQVFGGGNQAAFNGTPTVTVHCGADATTPISIEEVYGGGNQASVTGTNVTIEAGNIIGDVYGGGRQAAVGGNTSVIVNGGTIRRVFGGNNISGAISGTISVNVDKTSSCPMKIGQVFGGGNQAASQVGSITVGCTGDLVTPLDDGQRYGYDQEGIGAVYGGANNADIDGDITLNIVSGIVDSVFGGNNAGGAIDGDITVNIAKNAKTCSWYVGYVFGGGNNATYSQKTADHPAVNVQAGLVTHHVFGGGNGSGATVTGNPTVTLSGTAQVGGNVFGGGNAAAVSGNTSVKLQN